jgi:hypothetical protein
MYCVTEGSFITKPFDVHYFYEYFTGKVGKFRKEMPTMNSEPSCSCIKITNNEIKAL